MFAYISENTIQDQKTGLYNHQMHSWEANTIPVGLANGYELTLFSGKLLSLISFGKAVVDVALGKTSQVFRFYPF